MAIGNDAFFRGLSVSVPRSHDLSFIIWSEIKIVGEVLARGWLLPLLLELQLPDFYVSTTPLSSTFIPIIFPEINATSDNWESDFFFNFTLFYNPFYYSSTFIGVIISLGLLSFFKFYFHASFSFHLISWFVYSYSSFSIRLYRLIFPLLLYSFVLKSFNSLLSVYCLYFYLFKIGCAYVFK